MKRRWLRFWLLGDKTWVEADPGVKRVIRVSVPSRNLWFEPPVYIVRWSTLEGSGAVPDTL